MIERSTKRVPRPLSNPAAGLLEDTLVHYEISQAQAAKGMGIARSVLNEVIKGKRGVSAELAMRAEAFFGLSAEMLMDLQNEYDFQLAYHEKSDAIKRSVAPISA